VIAVLTKADALEGPALGQLIDEGLTIREAKPRIGEVAAQMLSRLRGKIESQLSVCKHPPKAYLELAGRSLGLTLNHIHSDWDASMQV